MPPGVGDDGERVGAHGRWSVRGSTSATRHRRRCRACADARRAHHRAARARARRPRRAAGRGAAARRRGEARRRRRRPADATGHRARPRHAARPRARPTIPPSASSTAVADTRRRQRPLLHRVVVARDLRLAVRATPSAAAELRRPAPPAAAARGRAAAAAAPATCPTTPSQRLATDTATPATPRTRPGRTPAAARAPDSRRSAPRARPGRAPVHAREVRRRIGEPRPTRSSAMNCSSSSVHVGHAVSSSSPQRAPEARRDLVHVGRAHPVHLSPRHSPSKTTCSTTRRCCGAQPPEHPLQRVVHLDHARPRAPPTATSLQRHRRAAGRRWKSAIRRAVIVRSQTANSPSRSTVERRLDRAHQDVGRDVLDRRGRHLQRHPPRHVVPVPVDEHSPARPAPTDGPRARAARTYAISASSSSRTSSASASARNTPATVLNAARRAASAQAARAERRRHVRAQPQPRRQGAVERSSCPSDARSGAAAAATHGRPKPGTGIASAVVIHTRPRSPATRRGSSAPSARRRTAAASVVSGISRISSSRTRRRQSRRTPRRAVNRPWTATPRTA